MIATQNLNSLRATKSRRQIIQQLQSENEKLKRRLARAVTASRRDPLTGLGNRRQFEISIAKLINRPRESRESFGLLFVDADHFKAVNDRYGHAIGDLVIQHLAMVMQAACREDDLVCRFGGEEFVVVPQCGDLHSLKSLGERIRAAVARHPLATPAGNVSVTVSVGGAVIDAVSGGFVVARLLEVADHEVYAAKASGRNCVRVRHVNYDINSMTSHLSIEHRSDCA